MNLKKSNKNKNSKQLEQEQNQRNGHHTEGFQWGGGREEWWGKVLGRRSMVSRYKMDRQRQKKNGIGNRELKELICTTHGHELRGGRNAGR